MKLQTLSLSILIAFHASAYADDSVVHRVSIDGSRSSQLGLLDAANAGTIGQKKLESMTTYRPGELLEAIPGVIVSQHSGEGKANQFYLRGFNLDHGTDLRTTIDEMPVNQRSHSHGQGWTDLNFLIPELAARMDYKKGPYSSTTGDFSSAGSAAITYANRLRQSIFSSTVGEHNYQRALLAASPDFANGSLLYALELMHNDGPFVQGDNFKKVNAVLRYSEGFANNGFNLSAMAYRGSWNATDQIPLRAVENGSLNRFDAIDHSDGGQAHRYSLSGVWRRTTNDEASKLNAYIIHNQLDLFSNFTYYMDDPLNGDQFSQPDQRVTSGINASHTWHSHLNGYNTDFTVGTQIQHDNIFNGLNKTRERQVLSTVRHDHIKELSAGLYADVSTRWSEYFRSNVGLRFDRFQFHVRSDWLENSGSTSDQLLSPSASLVFSPWKQNEFYLNLGRGFHSNDARATLTRIDPQSLQATEVSPGLARSSGQELGIRSEWLPGLQTSISLYRLDFDSELNFVGDAGTTEAGRPSRRHGIELSSSYQASSWLSLDLDAAYARARYRHAEPISQYVVGAIEGVAQLSATVDKLGPWSGALRLRYFGPRALTEDNLVRSRPSTTLNGRISYKWTSSLKVELEGFNLSNRRDSAIDYYYASQLKGETSAKEDKHFHPIEPRSFRLMLIKSF
ncbi:TonB-dependent receptor [Undibacterium sp. LX40W]|uniref:TonB-dependent receptor n=1 Tax=Undibacterium nitidum TaxID=2762298 RepID=A0A923KT13_9BURK|nr:MULTISPECIES: TonB-dependent receptor [Undibacterium]MBC3881084.1 TonB-dependent receptor [Undibacterium nitidum]MBC3890183.1 TonB-dependent receptor [Undibacterium sp. LX40W]